MERKMTALDMMFELADCGSRDLPEEQQAELNVLRFNYLKAVAHRQRLGSHQEALYRFYSSLGNIINLNNGFKMTALEATQSDMGRLRDGVHQFDRKAFERTTQIDLTFI
jgi:hypothetical protein